MRSQLLLVYSFCFTLNASLWAQPNTTKITEPFKNETEKVHFSGNITDAKTGLPLPGTSIYLPDLHTGAISDEKGFFKLPPLKTGKYLVEISFQGYSTIIETIELAGETSRNFSLTPAIVEQEAVTVTGVSFATRTRQNPQTVNVVKNSDLLNTSSSNIIDALSKTVPGLTVLSTGPAISKPFIRGLGYNRVVTVNDGVRQEGQQWGDEHGIEVDDYSAQRVEVLKGPASLMYGSDAIAGVINIQSQLPAPEGTIRSAIASEYQTNSGLRGIYGSTGGTKNGFSWNAYADYKAAHDYHNKYDGFVFNSKFYNKNYGAMLGYRGNWGSSRILVTSFDQHIGMVEGDRDEITGQFIKELPGGEYAIATSEDFKRTTPEVPFQHISHFKVTSDNVLNIGKNHLDFTLAIQRNRRREFGNVADIETPNAFFDLATLNYAIRYHLPSNKKWKAAFGLNGMYQSNENKAIEAIIPDYHLFDAGVFFFSQYIKDKFSASGGVRIDNRHAVGLPMTIDGENKFNSFEKSFTNISGSVGLSYQLSKEVTFKANVARGFRAPNFAELASNGAHEGTNRYEVGNNDLKSEVSTQADAGIEVAAEHVSLYASVFYNYVYDFIFYERVSGNSGGDSIIIDPESGKVLNVYRFDQKNAILYGAELHIDLHPHPLDWLHFENTFSYTRGKFRQSVDGSDNLPLIPAAKFVSELKGNFLIRGKVLKNLYASITGDYTFSQNNAFTGYNTETNTSNYFLLNAGVGADVVSKGKTIFGLHFSATNIGDVTYQNHLSRLKYTPENLATGRYGVFDMGRNFSIKVNIPLNYKI
ncbi:MAG: TonB-dependent receptor [Chitinophagaceae bacterium]|nr:TonB-dependent receptor [Panacibacter sp.]